MHPLATRVLRTVRAERLFPTGARVLVAVSGGPDSVALLSLLDGLARHGSLVIAVVGHFNHQLRGEASDADERFCRDLAARFALPFEAGTADVRAQAVAGRTSIEDAARMARYGWLQEAAVRADASFIATGHTKDDQAETVLLKLFRGAGGAGLGGIYPRKGPIVRPLLDISRRDVLDYLAERGLPFCQDHTNADLTNPRNRVRLELIPYLREHFSPGIVDVLARQASRAREDEGWLAAIATETARSLVLVDETPGNLQVDVVGLLAQPEPIGRRVARQVLKQMARGRFISASHVGSVLDLAAGRVAGPLQLPGQTATREGSVVRLSRREGRRGQEVTRTRLLPRALALPGSVEMPEVGLTVAAAMQAGYGLAELPATAHDEVVVAAGGIRTPLSVRGRKAGDFFTPLGLIGRKKLQDFFVDRKVARSDRDGVPLVVDAQDRIVWVVGHAISEDFRVTDPAQGVIILKAKRLGGS